MKLNEITSKYQFSLVLRSFESEGKSKLIRESTGCMKALVT